MYVAKRSGRGVAVYEPALDPSSVHRLTLLGELRRAITDGDQLFLEHQPCFDVTTGRVVGFEALVRWQHPERGRLEPGEFIELAEVSGLIEPLSRWVLGRAIADHVAAGLDVDLSVNLSARNLAEPDLVPWIAGLLEANDFPAERLTVELTESAVMGDVPTGTEALARLRALGVVVSVDDFGTGHSALAYLKELPIAELKIDRAFVGGIGSNPGDAAICATVVELSHLLGLRVVAEGVGDDADLATLRRQGCDRAQGFHLARPVPATELGAAVRRSLAPAAESAA
jgi:EAL domain-containing protein (putative c-di-GMP-specific phosphodiesterase class I)